MQMKIRKKFKRLQVLSILLIIIIFNLLIIQTTFAVTKEEIKEALVEELFNCVNYGCDNEGLDRILLDGIQNNTFVVERCGTHESRTERSLQQEQNALYYYYPQQIIKCSKEYISQQQYL